MKKNFYCHFAQYNTNAKCNDQCSGCKEQQEKINLQQDNRFFLWALLIMFSVGACIFVIINILS